MIASGVDLSTFGEPTLDANTLAEIREGAERLATELNDYLGKSEASNNNGSSSTFSSHFRPWMGGDGKTKTNLSNEEIADLQLTTARKLREVRDSKKSWHGKVEILILQYLLLRCGVVATSTEQGFVIYGSGTKVDSSVVEMVNLS